MDTSLGKYKVNVNIIIKYVCLKCFKWNVKKIIKGSAIKNKGVKYSSINEERKEVKIVLKIILWKFI